MTLKPTTKEELAERLDRAIRDAESAAYAVADAASELSAAAEALSEPVEPKTPPIHDLARLVLRLHEDEHAGPMRYCGEACQAAWEAL